MWHSRKWRALLQGVVVGNVGCCKNLSSLVLVEHQVACKRVMKYSSAESQQPAGSSPRREETVAFGELHPQLAGRTEAQCSFRLHL